MQSKQIKKTTNYAFNVQWHTSIFFSNQFQYYIILQLFRVKVYSKLLPEIHISTLCQMQCIEISILKKIYLKQNKKGYDTTLK